MRFSIKFLLTILIATHALASLGCGLKNSGGSGAGQISTPVSNALVGQKNLASSEGGLLNGVTTNNYTVNTSYGQPLNQVIGKTTKGYQVRLNIQGQISQ